MTLNSFVIIFLLDYTCIIVNNICEHPLKCLLIEKIQNKYFDHAFFVNFVIVYINMIINFKNLLFTFP